MIIQTNFIIRLIVSRFTSYFLFPMFNLFFIRVVCISLSLSFSISLFFYHSLFHLLWIFLWQFRLFLFPICFPHPSRPLCCHPEFSHCVHLFCSLQIYLFKKLFFYPFSPSNFLHFTLIHWSCSISFIHPVPLQYFLFYLFFIILFLIDISAFPLLTFFFNFTQNVRQRIIDFSYWEFEISPTRPHLTSEVIHIAFSGFFLKLNTGIDLFCYQSSS